jgi:hypothetical protein
MDNVTIMFSPLHDVGYHLYERKLDGSRFMSIIAPDEWLNLEFYKLEFVGTYKFNSTKWEKI